MFRKVLLILALSPFLALAHCSNPCERLADATCKEQGESSKRCERVRERAEVASSSTQEHCTTALSLVEAMKKGQ